MRFTEKKYLQKFLENNSLLKAINLMVQILDADGVTPFSPPRKTITKVVGRPIVSVVRHRRVAIIAISSLGLAAILLATSSPAFAATTVNLGSAQSYAIIAGSTITNTGSSVINGDVGLSSGTSITGFPPGIISGTTNSGNSAAIAAQTSATAAYGVVANATPAATVAAGSLGGTTLLPGNYHNSTLTINGTLTLNGNGDANAVFIFQSDSTLVTASSSKVLLENGAQACNVFWQVGSSATLGTTTNFSGTILALTSATLDTGANVDGRILAQTGAVTLGNNTITVPVCAASSTSATSTTLATTTTSATATTSASSVTTVPSPTTIPSPTTVPSATTVLISNSLPSATTIPVGAPATGRGGTAGPTKRQLVLIGFAALLATLGAGAFAIKTRRQSR